MIHDAALAKLIAPIARTVETVLPEADLVKKLRRGKPLRCKLGLDLTSTTVHIGNGIPLWNLRRLQDMGHVAVLILGDYTAMVGDPSGKDKTRPMLSTEQVEANAATWLAQIGRILDLPRVEVHRNSEWFSKMPFLEVLTLSDRMTVQQMLERDSFEKRFGDGSPISIREFLYCLMQGWDSVMVKADVELGGTDQTFNLGVGRRLMEQEGLEPQVSLISPLIEGTDGAAKMSKSLGNSIGVTDPPGEMFGRTMRLSDALLGKFLRLVSDLPDDEIAALLAPGTNPRDAKLRLAEALVARYHSPDAARAARGEFVRVISEGQAPSEMPDVPVPAGALPAWDLVRRCGFAASNSVARQLLREGAVRVHAADDGPAADGRPEGAGPHRLAESTVWPCATGDRLQVGSRKWARLVVDKALPPFTAPGRGPSSGAPARPA
jgi:tyrosyl-tRNA synthetase